MPVTITPLGWSQQVDEESFSGRLRNISGYGFGLAHDRVLQRGYVLLELELPTGETIRFIADLLWCEAQEDGGYHKVCRQEHKQLRAALAKS